MAVASLGVATLAVRTSKVRWVVGVTLSGFCCYSQGKPIFHAQSDRSVNGNISRANYMITKLSREGRIAEARRVFDGMRERDIVSWTAIISGYAKCGLVMEARRLFDRAGTKNVVTWTAMLAGYVRAERISEAEKLFGEMPERNTVSWNTMIAGYAQNGEIDRACDLFYEMPVKNVVSWNTMISSLAQHGRIEEALELFRKMPSRDVISWTSMVAGLAQNGRIDDARRLFAQMPERNVVSWNSMLAGYVQNSRLKEAEMLFIEMPERDVATWNNMITGYIQSGNLEMARRLFDETPDRNVVTWTALIMGYSENGHNEEAIKLFSMMQRAAISANQGTFVSVLGACSSLAGLNEGKQIHQIVCKTRYFSNSFVDTALMSMYSKCGEIKTARLIFDRAVQKDVVYWNGMIAAYAYHGRGNEAVQIFHQMVDCGFDPNDVTFVGILSACSHAGMIDEGLKLFHTMIRNKSIKAREDHYACMVDLCGRAGKLKEAVAFIKNLDIMPSACIWGALLAACTVHGDQRVGEYAAKKLLEVEPDNAGTYLLLSNIYAGSGKWKEASTVRLKLKNKGLKKQPGCSWIEVQNRVHVFISRDKSHSQANQIYDLLQILHRQMKRIGYMPCNNLVSLFNLME
ncbi:Pentatricopeptide repeat-containing protein [Nymphaea thermarum]|nr:Pentatricopeptide repeat-containing protein [Nymphaea thermarum]